MKKPTCAACGSKKVEYVSKAQLSINLFCTAGGLLPLAIFIHQVLWVSGICLALAVILPFMGTSYWKCQDCYVTMDDP